MTIPEMIAISQRYAAEADNYVLADGKSAYALTSIAFSLTAAVQILDTAFGATARLNLERMEQEASEIENLYNQLEELRGEIKRSAIPRPVDWKEPLEIPF